MAWTLHFAHARDDPVHDMKTHRDDGGQFKARPLYPGEKGIEAHWAADGWLGPSRSLDASQKRKINFHCRESNPWFHVRSFISFKTLCFPHHTLQPLRRHRTRNDCASCPPFTLHHALGNKLQHRQEKGIMQCC